MVKCDGGRCPVGSMNIKHPGNPKIFVHLHRCRDSAQAAGGITEFQMCRHKPDIIQVYTWHMGKDSESVYQVYTSLRYIQISSIILGLEYTSYTPGIHLYVSYDRYIPGIPYIPVLRPT